MEEEVQKYFGTDPRHRVNAAAAQGGRPLDPRDVAVVSIAISLKRIADEICGRTDKMGLTDGVMHAIEQGILSAGRQG